MSDRFGIGSVYVRYTTGIRRKILKIMIYKGLVGKIHGKWPPV